MLTKWLWLAILRKSYTALGYLVCVNIFWWISESKDCTCFLFKNLDPWIRISLQYILPYWRHMTTHIIVIIGWDNGVMPVWCQAITLTHADLLSIDPWEQTQWNLDQNAILPFLENGGVFCWGVRWGGGRGFGGGVGWGGGGSYHECIHFLGFSQSGSPQFAICSCITESCIHAWLYGVIIGLDNGLSPTWRQTIIWMTKALWGQTSANFVTILQYFLWKYIPKWPHEVVNHFVPTSMC